MTKKTLTLKILQSLRLLNVLKKLEKQQFAESMRTFKRRIDSVGTNISICYHFSCSRLLYLEIKSIVWIGPNVEIRESGSLSIGNNVVISSYATIVTSNHNYKNAISVPHDDVQVRKSTVIGDNVWIGTHAKIIPGITIGEGSVIGMECAPCNGRTAFGSCRRESRPGFSDQMTMGFMLRSEHSSGCSPFSLLQGWTRSS